MHAPTQALTRPRRSVLPLLTLPLLLCLPLPAQAQQRRAAAKRRAVAPKKAPEAREDRPATTSQPASLPGERAFTRCLRLPRGQRVKVDLKAHSSLQDLVAWISSMTCQSFIVGDGVQGPPVTFIAPRPITAGEAYRAFLGALQSMGLTVVRHGRRRFRVVRATFAVRQAVPTYGPDQTASLPRGAEIVTQLWRPRAAQSATLLPVLMRLKSASGEVLAYAPTNTLLIVDDAANVRRLLTIARLLDQGRAGRETWILRPRHAEAVELKKVLDELFKGQGQTATTRAKPPTAQAAPLLVADAHANALILVSDRPTYRRALNLLSVLDVQGQGGRLRAWVYRLRHGDAEKIAKALQPMLSAAPSARRGSRATQNIFEGPVRVQAEKDNNALLVLATPRDYLGLRPVLVDLDRPRRQVFVEVHILEVTLGDERSLGVSYHGGLTGSSGTLLGGLTHGTLSSVLIDPSALMGLALGVQGPTLAGSAEALGLKNDISAFGVLIQALASDASVDIVSAPHVLTLDNEQAEIVVGETIPLRSGITSAASAAAASGADSSLLATLVQPVRREHVGVKLKITPTIGQRDELRLKIEQEVSEVAEKDFGGLGASVAERVIRTVVAVPSGQTVAIGGLIKTRVLRSRSKVPLLGDLPLLGPLFRSETRSKQKVNLLIVLTPHVVRDRADLRRIFRRKLEQRQDFLRRYGRRDHAASALLSDLDFQHKRGLLAEIDRAGAQAENQAALQRATQRAKLPPLGSRLTEGTRAGSRPAR